MFDSRAFLHQEFEHRVVDVNLPDLAPWFGESPPVWQVRGLTGDELARVTEAVEKHRGLEAIIQGLLSTESEEKAASVRKAMSLGNDTPADIVKRVEMLIMGSVSPKCDLELAVKIKDTFPVEFMNLTNTILRATGKGQVPGKSNGSGETSPSEPA